MRVIREIESAHLIEIDKYYAYESNGELHVGQVLRDEKLGWVMKNLNTGEVESLHTNDVFLTEKKCIKIKNEFEFRTHIQKNKKHI